MMTQIEETNGTLVFLEDLLQAMATMTMCHGRGAYLMSDPALPPEKVAAFVKTQLNEYIATTRAAE